MFLRGSKIASNLSSVFDRLMALGGDIGGLYGAIVALPGLVLSFYTVRMFHKSVSADLPVKDAKDSQMSKSLDEKLSSHGSSALTSKDV